jgi:uncharacterized heparinase superfamily protein
MHIDLIRQIRKQAGRLAYNSLFYNWSLSGPVPERLSSVPQDLWPGDPTKGQWFCDDPVNIIKSFGALSRSNRTEDNGNLWLYYLHSFDWLRDLKTLGGDAPRVQARDLIGTWIKNNPRWTEGVWEPDLIGTRISNWIGLYDFYGVCANEEFLESFSESLIRQSRHLSRSIYGCRNGIHYFRAIKGLLYSSLVLEGRDNWLKQGLDIFQVELNKQILSDGGHISRSPEQLLEALQITIDIRNSLLSRGYDIPAEIEHFIDRMAQALRFFKYPDKGLAVFNGAQQSNVQLVDAVLARSNARGRVLKNLPQSGYERMTVGRSILVIDTGKPPSSHYDKCHHSAPLSFEFIYGKQRVFVNCGSNPVDETWQSALKSTAAHNTLTIDDRNASEVSENGHLIRKPKKINVIKDHNQEGALLEASHDGYLALNGIIHRRRFFLSKQGHDLRGEEILTCSVGLGRIAKIALRFHLHPDISVALTQSGKEALIRLPGGSGWRFMHSSGQLAVEDSIYLGNSTRPRKCKQLVIYGDMEVDHALIKWALRREIK